jgi:hypothetical protein
MNQIAIDAPIEAKPKMKQSPLSHLVPFTFIRMQIRAIGGLIK